MYRTNYGVTIENENCHMRNYIDLESIRNKEIPSLHFNIEAVNKTVRRPQFILLPFVENAFKHGKLHSDSQPISITLKITNSKLEYKVCNEIEDKKKDKVGGLGLDNLKKRLELLYPNTHNFECKSENTLFTAQLEIPLQ